jgi:predicted signal transduction protein with EAL and GGDEF domain
MRWGQKSERHATTGPLPRQPRGEVAGLPAYAAFLHDCGDALAAVVDVGALARPAVLLVDLDGITEAVEGEGPAAADEVVSVMAARIVREVGQLGQVAHTADRQVGVLFWDLPEPAVALDVAYRIVAAVSSPATLASQRQVLVSASCGLVTRDVVGDRAAATDLLRAAGLAVREARRSGRNQIEVCTPEMIALADETLAMGNDLRRALQDKALRVYYQPLVRLVDGTIVGFEALVRWTHPVLGEVAPSRFVLVAEQFGLISELGAMVLATASTQVQEWSAAFGMPLDVHVNVSSADLTEDAFITTVKQSLHTSGLAPAHLVLEVTEGAVKPELGIARVRFDALHDLAVRIALDDFTTGKSTLGYLESLRVDILKVDRVHLDSPDRQAGDARVDDLLRGAIGVGRELGMEVYGEGIETEEERTRMREQGCAIGQGYLFARPLPAGDAALLLREQATRPDPSARHLLDAEGTPSAL